MRPGKPEEFGGRLASVRSVPSTPACEHRVASPPMPTVRVAVFDLGSSSFHLMVVDASRDGALDPVLRRRSFLHLGTEVARSGAVPPDRAASALRAVRRLHTAAEEAEVDVVVALATAALRDAGNGALLIQRIEQIIDSPVDPSDRRRGSSALLPRATGGGLGRQRSGPGARSGRRQPRGRGRQRRRDHGRVECPARDGSSSRRARHE